MLITKVAYHKLLYGRLISQVVCCVWERSFRCDSSDTDVADVFCCTTLQYCRQLVNVRLSRLRVKVIWTSSTRIRRHLGRMVSMSHVHCSRLRWSKLVGKNGRVIFQFIIWVSSAVHPVYVSHVVWKHQQSFSERASVVTTGSVIVDGQQPPRLQG